MYSIVVELVRIIIDQFRKTKTDEEAGLFTLVKNKTLRRVETSFLVQDLMGGGYKIRIRFLLEN